MKASTRRLLLAGAAGAALAAGFGGGWAWNRRGADARREQEALRELLALTLPDPDGKPQAPHIVFAIFSRGMLRQVYTRMYFADEKANATDPVLALVPADRRDTLIAKRETRDGKPVYRFDIRVQGGAETVFFEV